MKPGKSRYKAIQSIMMGALLLTGLAMEGQEATTGNNPFEFPWTTLSSEALEIFNTGMLHADAGDCLTSYSCFSEAIDIDPYFAIAYAYRAFCGRSKEEFVNDTRDALLQVHKVNDFEEVLILINETYITGDEDQRLNLVMRLTGMAPENARAWRKLGIVLQERNEINEARRIFEKARTLAPDWIGIYTILGESYLNYKPVNLAKGLEYYTMAAALHPEIARIHLALGDIYTVMNEADMASQEYSKAISENPESWIDYMQNGYAKTRLEQFEEARTDYQLARTLSQANDFGYVMEALTYAYEGYPEVCLQWLKEKTSSIDKLDIDESTKRAMKYGCATASGWIALHYNKPEHFSKAIVMHNELNRIAANSIGTPGYTLEMKVENLFWEGLEAAINGYYDVAIVKACDIKIMLKENTGSKLMYKYHFLFGYAMYCQGRYGKAIEHLEQGDPNWVYNKYQLAKAYEANGEIDIAYRLFKEVAAYNINEIEYAIIRNEVKDNLASK